MSDPISLALMITDLEVGGAERCLVQLATHLDRQRFAPQVYCLAPRPVAEQDALVRRLEAARVPVHFVGTRSPRQLLTAVGRLRALLAAQRPQVMQTFLFHANMVGALAASAVPQVKLVTGVRVADPSRWRHWLEWSMSTRVARTVCVSEAVADFCRVRVGLPTEKLVVIPNGIDLAAYPAARTADLSPLGVPAGRRAVVCVGRLHPQKGIDWLLTCAPHLLAELADHDLVIVGEGPQRAAWQQLAASLGIAKRVHFAGWRADVPEILAACDLLVLPSRWEGMPNVLLEAMASARPVVATRTHGVAEVLGPLTDAQTVTFGDSDGLIAAIALLLRDPTRAHELAAQNRRRVAEHFSLPAMVAAYAQLYGSLVEDEM